MSGHVDECDVRGWGWDLALVDDEQAPNTPFRCGWSHVTEADLIGAKLAPGVEFLFIPSETPVLEPDEVVHPSTPDLMAALIPRKEPLMLVPPNVTALLPPAAPALPVRRRATTVVHLTDVSLVTKIVNDIDVELVRLDVERARLRKARKALLKVAA